MLFTQVPTECRRVYNVIKDHPGLTAEEIRKHLPRIPIGTVTGQITRLAGEKWIIPDRIMGRSKRWRVATIKTANPSSGSKQPKSSRAKSKKDREPEDDWFSPSFLDRLWDKPPSLNNPIRGRRL